MCVRVGVGGSYVYESVGAVVHERVRCSCACVFGCRV